MAIRVQGPLDEASPHSDRFLMALGRLVAESSLLESQIDWLCWVLISRDTGVTQIVTADLQFRNKVHLAQALVHHAVVPKDKAVGERFIEILKGCHSMYDDRNDFIHGVWIGSDKAVRGHFRVTAKGELRPKLRTIDASPIERLADRFRSSTGELVEAMLDLHNVIMPLSAAPGRAWP
jgi:hypothetical protein